MITTVKRRACIVVAVPLVFLFLAATRIAEAAAELWSETKEIWRCACKDW